MGVTKPSKKTIGWRKTRPETLLNKMIGLHLLKEIGVQNVLKCGEPKIISKLVEYDEDNNPHIDWEEALFRITPLELSKVIIKFSPASIYDTSQGADNSKIKKDSLNYVAPVQDILNSK